MKGFRKDVEMSAIDFQYLVLILVWKSDKIDLNEIIKKMATVMNTNG
jgi:hypothetical protein